MCGITGIVNLHSQISFEVTNLRNMNNSLKHRGPDDEGYVFFNDKGVFPFAGDDTPNEVIKNDNYNFLPKTRLETNIQIPSVLALGHRRLSIIDLNVTGHQPMSYLNRYWIVFNGEIYNYIEIRNELKINGYNFNTNSDTEVILASYDLWGVNCLNKFNGMWAFAIYDTQNNTLFLSRDRFGVKPLYYYIDEEKLIFASEAKAFAKNDYIFLKPNYSYIKDFLKSGPKAYIEETAFQDIYTFPAGHYFKGRLDTINKVNFKPINYYSLDIKLRNKNELKLENLIDEYLFLIEDAVKLRLRADVEVGTALSGGLDSSTIAYFINKILKESKSSDKQISFSIVFNTDKNTSYCDESYFINLLSNELNIKSYFIEPKVNMVMQEYENTVYAMDFPQEDSLMSCVFTYKLAKMNGVKVTIDGQGADELQAGYLYYLRNYFANLNLTQILNEYKKFIQIPGSDKQIKVGCVMNLFKKLNLSEPVFLLLKKIGYYSNPFIPVNEYLLNTHKGNLQNLLLFGDRSSMAHSIETRYPFMDFRLVEFWFSLPEEFKVKDGWTKYLARKAMNKKLPDEIVWRLDKKGWEIPQKEWFKQLYNYVLSTIKGSTFLDELNISTKLSFKDIPTKTLIKYLNLVIWHNTFFSNKIND